MALHWDSLNSLLFMLLLTGVLAAYAVHVSKSGEAITQPGDLIVETGPVMIGSRDLALEIRNVAR